MTEIYEKLRRESDLRWKEMTEDGTPWIRVGSAICGRSVGAMEVVTALEQELQRLEVGGHLPRPRAWLAASPCRSCEPWPIEGHVGHREWPDAGTRRSYGGVQEV